MSHPASRTNTWDDRHATDSPTHTSATSYPTATDGPESDPSTAPTGTAATNQAGRSATYPAHATPDTTCGPATAAPASMHPSSGPTAASSTAHNPATRTVDALRHQIGNPDSPLERWLLETSPLQRWLLETDLTPWQRCLLHDIIAGQSLKADSPKIALTSRYATPNFPSNPTLPDSSGSQEFFLGDSENFGGASW
ncbi:Uncharacterised protein [Mycobacteroides abscessus subsp. abscessus]|nr:Uncharacterised protein [Mycobacteroides abscessus subsp. abscessus]